MISLIAAISENRVIGDKGKIPWHIREDLIRFKEKTMGHAMIVGRKTFDSLIGYYQKSGRPMPKRTNIIVTKNPNYIVKMENCIVVHSFDEALEKAKQIEKDEIFVAGGGQLFAAAIEKADKLYLTIVKKTAQGDTYFPDYSDFGIVAYKQSGKSGDLEYTFLDLLRGARSA